jgi:hypothetical protein
MPYQYKVRDKANSTSKEMSKIARKPAETRGKAWDRFSHLSRRKPICGYLDLGLLSPRTMTQYISIV